MISGEGADCEIQYASPEEEKRNFKNKFLFLLQTTGKYCMMTWKIFTYEGE